MRVSEPEAEPQMEMDIIRRKSFQIDPMTADEAIIQMEMLAFFLLYLSEENQKLRWYTSVTTAITVSLNRSIKCNLIKLIL